MLANLIIYLSLSLVVFSIFFIVWTKNEPKHKKLITFKAFGDVKLEIKPEAIVSLFACSKISEKFIRVCVNNDLITVLKNGNLDLNIKFKNGI